MRKFLSVALLALCLLAPAASVLAQSSAPAANAQSNTERKVFPYAYTIDDLPNGLRLVTVPTDYPNLVALYIVVSVGSRNEVEPGKSGFAHFFEHMMFRGSQNFTPEQRDGIMKRAGASSNAYTSDDRTVYHEVFAKEDLPQIMRLEADRFQRLQYPENLYRTESLAVLGEYNKNSANPISKMYETLRETAFKQHTYSHTTMGYLKDIQDMPNQYAYSQEFYKRFYRPEYTTIVVVGDVKRDEVLRLARDNFGSWQRGDYKPAITPEPQQDAPRTAHVEWASPTLPYVAVAFRAPAYDDSSVEKAALDLLSPVAFGENSELYQRLVLKEQKADFVSGGMGDSADPELFTVFARVKDPKDVEYVKQAILDTYKRYTTELVPQARLDQTRSRMRYGFAMGLDSSEAIASALAPYISLRRTPETLNKMFATYERVTPEDIRRAAAKYFQDNSRTIVTLATKGASVTAASATKEGATR